MEDKMSVEQMKLWIIDNLRRDGDIKTVYCFMLGLFGRGKGGKR
ncbi:hypothetical protein [Hungatella hathewayi]